MERGVATLGRHNSLVTGGRTLYLLFVNDNGGDSRGRKRTRLRLYVSSRRGQYIVCSFRRTVSGEAIDNEVPAEAALEMPCLLGTRQVQRFYTMPLENRTKLCVTGTAVSAVWQQVPRQREGRVMIVESKVRLQGIYPSQNAVSASVHISFIPIEVKPRSGFQSALPYSHTNTSSSRPYRALHVPTHYFVTPASACLSHQS